MMEQELPEEASMDWKGLLDAIHATQREHSTAPDLTKKRKRDAPPPPTQEDNQAVFEQQRVKHSVKLFNPQMSDDAFWDTINVMPFYAGVRPPKKESIGRAKEMLADFRQVGRADWISSPEAQAYMRLTEEVESETEDKHDVDPKSLGYWNSHKTKGPRILAAARNLYKRHMEREASLIDLAVPPRYRGTDQTDWSVDNLLHIWQNMRTEIRFGRITTFHAMMELGVPVVKPDRMLVRTVVRLGLVTAYGNKAERGRIPIDLTLKSGEALTLGRDQRFARELQPIMQEAALGSGRSIREVDWLFAKMGMKKSEEEGREVVICDTQPLCNICGAHPFCAYGQKFHPRKKPKVPFQRSRPKNSKRAKPRPDKALAVAAE